jgi:HEAT repeat protein
MSSARPKQPLRTWAHKPAEAYLQALCDHSPRVRRQAVAALEILKHKAAVPALLPLLHDPDEEVRLVVVRALGALGDKRMLVSLIDLLDSASDRMSATILAALDKQDALKLCRTPKALAILIGALTGTYHQRHRVARALAAIGDPQAVQPIVEALRLEVMRSLPGEIYSDDLARSLGIIGAAAVPALLELLTSSDRRLRRLGAIGLWHVEDPRAIEPLRKALLDEDEDVRVRARLSLQQYDL